MPRPEDFNRALRIVKTAPRRDITSTYGYYQTEDGRWWRPLGFKESTNQTTTGSFGYLCGDVIVSE